MVHAEDVTVNKPGQAATGIKLTNDADKTYDEDLNVTVKGSGGGARYEVTGISLMNGAQMIVNGAFNLVVQNENPATIGKTFSSGADAAHYNMSGVYAGYGGGTHRISAFTLNVRRIWMSSVWRFRPTRIRRSR